MRRLVNDTLVITERNLVRLPRAPELVIAFTVQPIMFVGSPLARRTGVGTRDAGTGTGGVYRHRRGSGRHGGRRAIGRRVD